MLSEKGVFKITHRMNCVCIYLCQTHFYPCPHFTSKSNKTHVPFSPFSNPTSKRNLKKLQGKNLNFQLQAVVDSHRILLRGYLSDTCLSLTSIGWLWYFLDQKSGPVNWKGNRHSLSWYMWLPLSGPFYKTLYFLVLNSPSGEWVRSGNVFGMLINWNSQDLLMGRMELCNWEWGCRGQTWLYIQHAYGSVEAKLKSWDRLTRCPLFNKALYSASLMTVKQRGRARG